MAFGSSAACLLRHSSCRRRPLAGARCCARPLVAGAAAPVATSAAPASTASSAAPSRPALRLRFGTKNIPHPKKAHYGGEDAYFVSEAGAGVAGIADGVGGWQEAGINPADYSRSLMKVARQYLEECSTVAGGTLSSGEWLAGQRAGGQPGGDALAAELAQRAAAQAGSSGSGGASSSSSSVSSGDAFVAAASAARIDIPPPLTSGDADGPRTAQVCAWVGDAVTWHCHTQRA